MAASLALGVAELGMFGSREAWLEAWELIWISRVPRTLALVFAGAATAVSGLILQMLLRNRYVEPTVVGTGEGACLGLLLAMLLMPDLPVLGRMGVAALGGLGATLLYLAILSRVPLRSMLVVPLVGLVLNGVLEALISFLAYRFELMQSLTAWRMGDFSQVLAGRWELLWIAFGLTVLAGIAADRFTIAGLGRDTARSLGLAHGRVMVTGLVIISAASACVIVTVGVLPFVGLVVPNLISLMHGDHLRRTVPIVALTGALSTLLCDLLGRTLRQPYEIPIGVVVGALGSVAFLILLWREKRRGGA